ncbi:MAG: putative Rossmann fold flavoprotein [Candidatus Paceibacteria bacterium]|jgi:predicted Rossmann fold flavoprotein
MIQKTKQNIEVLVIGGGASGLIAAGRAAELGKKVVLLEKNKALGEKLKITGGGRCNITNSEKDTKKLLSHYGEAEKFLHSPFSIFGVKETFEFFESRGLPIMVENNNRAFPKSEKAMDVFNVLDQYVRKGGVLIQLGHAVERIVYKSGKIQSVETDKHIFFPEKVIVATGGVSHPETGSTGDGFKWLKDMGHTVKEPTPDIVPLSARETWVKNISGVALDDVKITFYCDEVKKFKKQGRMLCTHFGISGPMILNSASEVRDLLHSGQVTAKVDLFPNTDTGSLEKELVALFDENKNKMLGNILQKFLPAGFMPAFKELFQNIDLEMQVNAFKKEDRKKVVQRLKELDITIKGLMGFERSVVSDGGVLLSEIDMKTMQSKKCDNLYITGDLLHISRPSGGYSLQLCWTTGYIAGGFK